jgi:hypothetical protein
MTLPVLWAAPSSQGARAKQAANMASVIEELQAAGITSLRGIADGLIGYHQHGRLRGRSLAS